MTPLMGRLLALVAAGGLAASILGYIYTFFGVLGDKILLWGALLLIPGWMVLFLPMYILEYPLSRAPSFCWKGFARGMPSWVAPCSWLLSVIAIAHLIWFAVHTGWGVPEIVNGQYVLDSRGRILEVLTQAEYSVLMEEELRAFTTMMIYFYFVTTMYWWFRQSRPVGGQVSI